MPAGSTVVDWAEGPPPWKRRRLAVRVKPAALRQIRKGHPWLFEGSIISIADGGRPGDLAVVFDGERAFAAIGIFDPASPIRVRILHQGKPEAIGPEWLASILTASLRRRSELMARGDTTAFRIVHGENDGLGGLVADLYGRHLVLKVYSEAWLPWLSTVVDVFCELLDDSIDSITARFSRSLRTISNEAVSLFGLAPETIVVLENGLRLEVDVRKGHKTGLFLDQRHNRALIGEHSRDRTMLDVFSSTGGFALHAAAGGARTVTAVDISRPALKQARRAMALNGLPAEAPAFITVVGDAFEELTEMGDRGERYGMVVVDPPSMASRRSQLPGALDAYRRLAQLAASVTANEGLLYLASCTARVAPEDFRRTSHAGLDRAGVGASVLAETSHDIDHPVGFPEGRYLKGMLLEIRR